MNSLKSLTFIFLLIFLITSCVSKKKTVYFQNDEISQTEVYKNFKTIIKIADALHISVSALDTEAVSPFNTNTISNYQEDNINKSPDNSGQTYLVDSKGEIDFPVLGKLKVAGFSKEELKRMLQNKLSPDYVKNPTVNISITNFKFSVLGDVGNPGNFTVKDERITLLQAIALAGDLAISGQRENVTIIREEAGAIKRYSVDLRSNTLFNSPVYFLQQNDVVYVEQNYASTQSASFNQNTGLFISIGAILISLITNILR